MSPAFSLRLDNRRLNAELSTFARRKGPEAVSRAVRKIALDVQATTVRGVGGSYGLIKRVDTGRYRAAWQAASLVRTGGPLAPVVTVINNVEYGPQLEYGTAGMPAGHHLAFALAQARKQVRALVESELQRAFR